MKKQTRNKLLMIAVALLLTVVTVLPLLGTSRAKADSNSTKYTAITISNVELKKVLDIPSTTTIPSSGFGFAFTIEPIADEIPATDGYFAVLPGPTYTDTTSDPAVTYPRIADVVFATTDTTRDDSKDDEATYDSSITKTTSIDFSDVKFEEPGVYRYIITETAAAGYTNTGVGYDSNSQKVLDVYIINDPENEGSLKVQSCILLKKVAGTNVGAPSTTANWDTTLKSDKFVNKYPTNTLTLKKTVTGNQGSKDQYFAFEIKLADNGTVTVADNIVVGVTGQDKEPTANSATEYAAATMKTANNITSLTGTQLKAGYTMYLQNDDEVTFTGLVENCSFTITETKKDYTVSTKIEKDGEENVTGTTNTVTSTMDKSATVTFTNNKQGTIPTGVILSVAPWAIAGIVILAGVVFFAIHSKRRFEEE